MVEEIENANEVKTPVTAAKSPLTPPMILILLALTAYFGFQSLQFLFERNNLVMVKGSQESAIQEAQKIQAQFKTLVSKTGELADKGHAGAKMVMEELLKRGVSSAPPAAPPDAKMPGKTETKPSK
jgi:hypothetical protein